MEYQGWPTSHSARKILCCFVIGLVSCETTSLLRTVTDEIDAEEVMPCDHGNRSCEFFVVLTSIRPSLLLEPTSSAISSIFLRHPGLPTGTPQLSKFFLPLLGLTSWTQLSVSVSASFACRSPSIWGSPLSQSVPHSLLHLTPNLTLLRKSPQRKVSLFYSEQMCTFYLWSILDSFEVRRGSLCTNTHVLKFPFIL